MATFVTGLGSGWALVKESTFGTAVVTTRALPIISESLALDVSRVRAKTLRGGVYLPTTSSYRVGSRVGGGDVNTLVFADGAALLTEAMLGTIGTTGAGPYVHTATVSQVLPSYSMQVSFGTTTTTKVKKLEGCMVDSWELSYQIGEPVTLGMTWVYEDEAMVASGAASDDLSGSYPASLIPYQATDVAVTIEGTSYCITGLTISGNNALKKDFHCLGTTLIKKPVRTDECTITGTIEMPEDVDTKTLYDAYTAGTVLTLVATATNGADTFVVNAEIDLQGVTPQVSGPDIVSNSIPFSTVAASTDAAAFSLVTTNSDATA